ncbi:hypothetical protein AAC387_Pa10g2072 [Persea americana]
MSNPIAINDCPYLSGCAVFSGSRWRPTLTLVLWHGTKDSLAVARPCTGLALIPSCQTVVLSLQDIDRAAEVPAFHRATELTIFYHRG